MSHFHCEQAHLAKRIFNISNGNPTAQMSSKLLLNSVLVVDSSGMLHPPSLIVTIRDAASHRTLLARNDTFFVICCQDGFARHVIDDLHSCCERAIFATIALNIVRGKQSSTILEIDYSPRQLIQ